MELSKDGEKMSRKFAVKSLKKSKGFVTSATEDILTGSINSGISSLYYSAFQAVCAVVLLEESTTNSSGIVTEKQVLDYLGRKELHEMLTFYKKLWHLKQNAGAHQQEVITREEAIKLIEEVTYFNQAVGSATQEFKLEEAVQKIGNDTSQESLSSSETFAPSPTVGKTRGRKRTSPAPLQKVYLYEVEMKEALCDVKISAEKRKNFHRGVLDLGSFITSVPLVEHQFQKVLEGNLSFVFLPDTLATFIEIAEVFEGAEGDSLKPTGRLLTARISYAEKIVGSSQYVCSFKPVIFKESD